MMEKVELYFDSRRKCSEQIETVNNEPEMSEFESAFLAGLLYKFKPKKIVEVGIAAGGTTAIILQTLEDIKSLDSSYDYLLFSVDLSESYYRDQSRVSGFLGDQMASIIGTNNYKKMTGKVLPERIEEIGGEIDFVILDTVHALPGEVLDFLAIFPFLSSNAIICLHDLTYHYNSLMTENRCSNSVLFNAIVGNRIIDMEQKQSIDEVEYPNIGAVQITEDTGKYIDGIFCSLTLNWSYVPEQKQLEIYQEHYQRYYPSYMTKIFQNAIKMASRNAIFKSNQVKLNEQMINAVIEKNNDIVFWGAGNVCKSTLLNEKIFPSSIVDSCDTKIGTTIFGWTIYKASAEFLRNKFIIITCKECESIISQLKEWDIYEENYITIWDLCEDKSN